MILCYFMCCVALCKFYLVQQVQLLKRRVVSEQYFHMVKDVVSWLYLASGLPSIPGV